MNLIKVSRKRSLKFNMLLDYCIGRAAVKVKEFYILTVSADRSGAEKLELSKNGSAPVYKKGL